MTKEQMYLDRIQKILDGFKAGKMSAKDVAFHAYDMMRWDNSPIVHNTWEKFFKEGCNNG